ncbi:MAG: hypothetical protein LBG96_06735 [Tannerella sp.]|jgi:hypothetical protein|nr:hypothetical protein [Tannerella sp.]
MTGFEIKLKNETIYASADNVHIIVNFYESSSCSVSGTYRSKSERVSWYYGNMDDMDTVSIKVVEVEQISEIKDSHPMTEDFYELLDYRHLQKILKKEGLI